MAPIKKKNSNLLLSADKRRGSHFPPLELTAVFKLSFCKSAVATPAAGLEQCSGMDCTA